MQQCCRLCSTYIQTIPCIIVQFNAPVAHIQPTPSLYILLNFFVDFLFWHLYAGTLIDKQYNVIVVDVFCTLIVVIVLLLNAYVS